MDFKRKGELQAVYCLLELFFKNKNRMYSEKPVVFVFFKHYTSFNTNNERTVK